MATAEMRVNKSERYLTGVASGVGAGALWGLVFLAPRVLSGYSPLQLSAARYLVYGVISSLFIASRWRRIRNHITLTDIRILVRLSLLGNIVYYIFLVTAVRMAGIASTSLIIGLLPVMITIIGSREKSALPLRRLIGPLVVIGLGIFLMNIGLFLHRDAGAGAGTKAIGVGCAVVALLSWTIYAVENARWLNHAPQFTSSDWSLLTGVVTGALALLIALPAFLWNSGVTHSASNWSRFWLVSGAVAIGASIVGNALWNEASRILPLTLTGKMILFETLFALLYGFLWERRFPHIFEAVSIILLTFGVYWSAKRHQHI